MNTQPNRTLLFISAYLTFLLSQRLPCKAGKARGKSPLTRLFSAEPARVQAFLSTVSERKISVVRGRRKNIFRSLCSANIRCFLRFALWDLRRGCARHFRDFFVDLTVRGSAAFADRLFDAIRPAAEAAFGFNTCRAALRQAPAGGSRHPFETHFPKS